MKIISLSVAVTLLNAVVGSPTKPAVPGPFLSQADNQTWTIGNELWNLTQGRQYGVKLFYKDHDCVGDAVGHYVSYSECYTLRMRLSIMRDREG
jgi:rhamnogalacturonan endolyase